MSSAEPKALATPYISSQIDECVDEVRKTMADIRCTFNSVDATRPVSVENRDWWSMIVMLGCVLARVHSFNDAQAELIGALEQRIKALEAGRK